MKKVMIIAPHADDAELGLGAYIHREAKANNAEFKIVVLAQGDNSSSLKGQVMNQRQKEADASASLLGVSCVEFIGAAPDSAFNTVPMGQLVGAIEAQIREYQPDQLFIPLPSFHNDHVVTHDACVAALRPHPKRKTHPLGVYCYEYPGQAWGPKPPEWGRVYAKASAEDVQAKVKSLECYGTQWVSVKDSLLGERGVRALASIRGAEAHWEYAELFYLIRGEL